MDLNNLQILNDHFWGFEKLLLIEKVVLKGSEQVLGDEE
jgi:hypothetical protein